ncbi:MAG: response regulator [Syntrophales bacterium]|nr:response regulator [Syntrophales bacterium]
MKRILVVDDEPEILRLLTGFLSSREYDVFTASDGVEAISKVRTVRPDAVLLDIIMPGMGGIDVLKEIKAMDPETVVLMVTGVIDDQVNELARQAGADGYILKPFDFDDLDTILREKISLAP